MQLKNKKGVKSLNLMKNYNDFSCETNETDKDTNMTEDEFISSFRQDSDISHSLRDEAFYYLQRIARTPLLTAQRELELFQQFEKEKDKITELLDQFPLCVLEKVRAKHTCLLYTSPSPRD